MSSVALPAARTGFRAALRVPEFRALWLVGAVSVAGDQLARVALSVLVYERTGSALATGGVYALTFVPTLLGGVVLSGVADRYPRKQVMVATDLARAALLAAMALPALPLWALCGLLVTAVLLGAPFRAAETAMLPDVLPGDDLYTAGLALRSATLSAGQLAGYGVGGLVIASVDARLGLLVDAVTFLLSAAVVARWVHARPVVAPDPAAAAGGSRARWWSDLRGSVGALTSGRDVRVVLGLILLAGFYVVPEGLAAPYAAASGGGATATGLLMAADPAGSALGAWLLLHLVPPARRDELLGWLPVAAGVTLAVCWVHPAPVTSWLLWATAGVFSAYQVHASVLLVRALPVARRGGALGLASATLLCVQGLGVLAAGALSHRVGVVHGIALAGAAGALVAVVLAVRWRGVRGARAPHASVRS